MAGLNIREIQSGEFAMILFCGAVVNLCGLDFVFEVAEVDGFAVSSDFGAPSVFMDMPGDAFEF